MNAGEASVALADARAAAVVVLGDGASAARSAAFVRSFWYRVEECETSALLEGRDPEALDLILVVGGEGSPEVVERIRAIKRRFRSCLVVPHLSVCDGATAIELSRAGAWDVLLEPVDPGEVGRVLGRAADIRAKGRERSRLADHHERQRTALGADRHLLHTDLRAQPLELGDERQRRRGATFPQTGSAPRWSAGPAAQRGPGENFGKALVRVAPAPAA